MRTDDRRVPRAIALMPACLLSWVISTTSTAQTPDYQGTMCPIDDGARIRCEIETANDVSLMIIYLNAPAQGGRMMQQVAPGSWAIEFDRQGMDEIRFNILLQNPVQYVFPEHALGIESGCASFRRDDVTPPHARGFRHDIEVQDGLVHVRFEAGAPDVSVPAIVDVAIVYRLGPGELQRRQLEQTADYLFQTVLPDASEGDAIEYYFEHTVGIQPVETALFSRTIGEALLEPDHPLEARSSGRFRDRHPKEWRFDHYVSDYGGGKSFELIIVDHGTWIEVTAIPDPLAGVSRMDFKYYTQNDPQEMCDRPLTVQNMIMERQGNVFTQRVPDVSHGQVIDFDFSFIDLQCCNGVSYYSDFYYYHVGSGRLGGRSSNPRAYAAGDASISEVSTPRFAFAQHAQNLRIDELNDFLAGKELFETDHLDGELKNFPTRFDCCSDVPLGFNFDQSPHARLEALGPSFNAASCIACHHLDGRGATPTGAEENLHAIVMQLSIPGEDDDGGPLPHPLYGRTFSTRSTGETIAEGRLTVTYETIEGSFDDGTPYELRRPVYAFNDTAHGSLGTNIPDADGSPGYEGIAHASPRIAPMLAGVGLLEAVAESAILAHEDPDDLDGDGISGRTNRVWDATAGETVLGRFGWKAGQPNLTQQTAKAYQLDLGMTSMLFPEHDCGEVQPDCTPGSGGIEISNEEVELVAAYLRGLTLPPRDNFDDPEAYIGMQLFKEANCQSCHVPSLDTRSDHPIAALANQSIEAFTDLLLHDMGPGLADDRPDFQASGREWRTAPLWAAGFVGHVLGVPEECADPHSGGAQPNYLHDGRARSLMEAILWHGGEASASRDAVLAMHADERAALLKFVAYPFDDPQLVDPPDASCLGDLDGDGQVDGFDLTMLLGAWGPVSGPEDLDGNGIVDGGDLTALLAHWGPCP